MIWEFGSSIIFKVAPIWVFPKIGISQNGWFTIEIPIKIDDLGVPLFLKKHPYTSQTSPHKLLKVTTCKIVVRLSRPAWEPKVHDETILAKIFLARIPNSKSGE